MEVDRGNMQADRGDMEAHSEEDVEGDKEAFLQSQCDQSLTNLFNMCNNDS